MSKIDISFWAAFGLNHGPWSRRFCLVLEAIAKWRLMLSKLNPPKNSLFILFGRRRLSFIGWCKVKHLNNDFRPEWKSFVAFFDVIIFIVLVFLIEGAYKSKTPDRTT